MKSLLLLVASLLTLCLIARSQTKLHLFTSYHTAALAPGQLLHKEIPTNAIFTYEFQCSPVVCDGYLLKNSASYDLWRTGNRNSTLWIATTKNETAIATNYNYLLEYDTDANDGPVFAIDNPTTNQQSVSVTYNYRFEYKQPQNLPVILGVVLSIVGLGICCLVLFLIILIIWICRRKKEYLPVFDALPEF